MDKIKMKNKEENKKDNSLFKNQLKEICSQIEEILSQEEIKKNNKLQASMDKSNKVDIQEFTNFQSKINGYKKKIDLKQKEINSNLEYEKIIKNENEYDTTKKKLLDLKKENDVLTKMNKKLNEQLIEVNGGIQMNGRKVEMNEKLKNLKEEIKLMTGCSKDLITTIRAQNNEIIELEQYIKKVKSNIDYAKEEQQKTNENDKPNEDMIKKINELKESIKKIEIEKKEQEENYNINIKKQKKIKGGIEQDIKILKIKIQQTKYENKLNELKLKEIKTIQEEKKKEKLKKEKEEKLKEEKRIKEMIKRKKYLDFQKKLMGGVIGEDENNFRNYYNNTSEDNYYHNETENINTQSRPNTKFSRYSKNNAPFDIKFNDNSNIESRALTQGINDYDFNHNIENYNFDNENENSTYENKGNIYEDNQNKNGKVINDIDDLKNDIINVLNDDVNIDINKNINSKNKKKKVVKKIKNDREVQNNMSDIENNNAENIQNNFGYNNTDIKENKINDKNELQENIDDDNKNESNNNISEQIEDTENNNDLYKENKNNDIKISGNRNPFKMGSFNKS